MDNGKEFDNSASRAFFATHGIALQLTFPYTSQQNGRAERALHTLSDGLRALLFQASAPLTFWPDALTASTYLLNRHPCHPHAHATPYELLFGMPTSASLAAFAIPTPLQPRHISSHHVLHECIFLGYPLDQRGYKCYNPVTKWIIISRHVYFDEICFPFAQDATATTMGAHQCQPCIDDMI
jgi:histone deacetylase 1/2